MLSWLPSAVILGLMAVGALQLATGRESRPERTRQRIAASHILILAVFIQAVHFAEELATGLHERLPAVFGLAAMPLDGFVYLNLAFLAIWAVSVPGVRTGHAAAFFAAWFLAIAGMVNGIGHPLLAIATRGYFPGLLSSLLIGAVSVWLWLRLRNATTSKAQD